MGCLPDGHDLHYWLCVYRSPNTDYRDFDNALSITNRVIETTTETRNRTSYQLSTFVTVELPKEPKFVPFLRSYETPKAPLESERTPEVIEAEMKALELAMDALVLLTLKSVYINTSILFFTIFTFLFVDFNFPLHFLLIAARIAVTSVQAARFGVLVRTTGGRPLVTRERNVVNETRTRC